MELQFNTYGNEKQAAVWRLWADDHTTDIVYGGSKGSGKSFLGCSLIFADALTYPDTFYFIARQSLTDLRKFTLPSIFEVLQVWGITGKYYKLNGQDNFFQLYNGSRVYLVEASYRPSDPMYQRFGSMQMTRGWIEEAGEFCQEAKNNLQATIGRWKNDTYNLTGKLLQTCNPAKNYLYTDYYRPYKAGALRPWQAFVQALPTDNHRLPAGYLLNLERSLSTNQKQRLLFGNWEFDDNPDLLVTYDAVCDCVAEHRTQNTEHRTAARSEALRFSVQERCGSVFISADIAMRGRDRFVCVLWSVQDDVYCAKITSDIQSIGASEITRHIEDIAATHGVGRSHIVADSDGLGAYLADYLIGIKTFHGGARPIGTQNTERRTQNEFANLKSQCAYKLAELINARALHIDCTTEQAERIKEELMMLIAADIDADTSKRKIIEKDKMKQLIGHSPDYLDALLMGMYFHLQPEMRGVRKMSIGRMR